MYFPIFMKLKVKGHPTARELFLPLNLLWRFIEWCLKEFLHKFLHHRYRVTYCYNWLTSPSKGVGSNQYYSWGCQQITTMGAFIVPGGRVQPSHIASDWPIKAAGNDSPTIIYFYRTVIPFGLFEQGFTDFP